MFGFGAGVVVIVVVLFVDVVFGIVGVVPVSETAKIVNVVIFDGGNAVVCIGSGIVWINNGVVCIVNVVALVVCLITVDVDMDIVLAWVVLIVADEREVVGDIGVVVLLDLSKLITGTTDETW